MRFLIDAKFGSFEELVEVFSDIEGISLHLCDEWSSSSQFCFSTDDTNILPILAAGHLMVGNDRIDVHQCPLLYASTEAGDELDPNVVSRVVLRISQIQLASKDQKSGKCLEFSCPPQLIHQVCSTEYKVQGKMVTFSTRGNPPPQSSAKQNETVPPIPPPHPLLPSAPYLPNYTTPPHFYPHLPYATFPYPYPYGPPPLMPGQGLDSVSESFAPDQLHNGAASQRPIYSVELFHDGENCPCAGSLNPVAIFDTTLRLVMARFLGEAFPGESFDLHASVQVKWNFVLSPDKISSQLSRFLADLETLGATRIDPGSKSDAVDTSIKKLMEQYRADYLTRSAEANKNRIAVLISGDRDFAESLKALRLTGATVMLIYNSEQASRALRAIVPPQYVLDSWTALVRSVQTPPSSTQLPEPVKSIAPLAEGERLLRECEHCRLSKGESWYHKDGVCPSKPQVRSLVSDEALPREAVPSGECAWCLRMLGKSFVHRSSCPNNVMTVTKHKGRFLDSLCVWCLKTGSHSLNHRYMLCRNKPPGTHHCPYCYRVCGVVEFHTIYECTNSPSLSSYDQGATSKRSPHVNELSLKDQIFHLELKIVKCQETILKAVTRVEEKPLRVKLRTLFTTEETLVNQLRVLEVKTLSKTSSASSSSSFPPPPSSSSAPPPPSSSSDPLPSFDSSLAAPHIPDTEKYLALFGNGLLFGELEEISYDGSEGEGGDGDDADTHNWDQAGLVKEEEVKSQALKKRKHLDQSSVTVPTGKHSRRQLGDERGQSC
jgi:hypothetical protein